MFGSIATFLRLMRAAWTLARHDAIFPVEYQAIFPAPARLAGRVARLVAIRDRAANPGERLARALEELGPSYVKLGQVLATRADVVGMEFARGLSRLQDRMAPFPEAEARKVVEAELGETIDALFAEFGPPAAAASIAQVHKAVTRSGETVAVKVLRPGIDQRITRDIAVLRMGAGLAVRLFPASRRLEPRAFVETVARSLVLELDLRMEAAGASELLEAATAADNLNIPLVVWPLTARRVLTTEWIDAIPLTDMAAVEAAGIDRVKLAADITDAFLACALDRGVFHADMHAGNLFVDSSGGLWAVDFGIVGRLEGPERRYLARILHGFLTRDYAAAAEAHFEAGYVPSHHVHADFAAALRSVAEPIFGKRADEVPMSRVLLQLFEVTELFDMRLQPQLILLQKTMVQVEGVCRLLTPAHDMWQSSSPAVERFMRREIGPEGRVRDFLADLDKVRTSLLRLPDTLDRLTLAAERMNTPAGTSSAHPSRRWRTGLLIAGAALLGVVFTLALTGRIAL
ncbi:MAG: 2-polyprenylphenol 6-hydroxylase [Oceanicaulis sp.]|uniref:2-polyprenylphenol 6-hydroxylase n=1 Tax=Glycocaulis sp. TaxID=1969725 RepID=UPI0025BDF76C|nr:2-polyprenylphenol 6-hydroxylase [Glycocaulis sp.]MCC5980618.1 2-polyprenylphenol 6-hydroxylase [Oceanicaulis sp.]MCH8520656.1 2-polyprenylphenol 6-hydroxylase [Glycocaulis sp.]